MKKLFFVIPIAIATVFIGLRSETAKADADLQINSRSAILLDYDSGTVIYSKNETDKLTIASMTKIMLLNLCFEKLEDGEFSLSDKITVSKRASGMGGSQVFLEENKPYSADQLLKSIVVASANDASLAMAERLFGSEENCVEAMNAKCKEWNLANTLFSNCTGLPKPTQYSCAKDVAIMLKNLLSHKDYFNYSKIWIDEIEHEGGRKTEINNTNKLIRFYEGCDGGKTGYTAESGFCLASTAKRGAMRLVSVVIKATDSKARFADSSTLLNYGFENYNSKMVIDSSKPLDVTAKIEKGVKKSAEIVPERDLFVFAKKGDKDKISVDFKPNNAVAPIKKGDKLGELIVFKDNVEYGRVNAVSCCDIDEKTYFDYIKDIAQNWQI